MFYLDFPKIKGSLYVKNEFITHEWKSLFIVHKNKMKCGLKMPSPPPKFSGLSLQDESVDDKEY